MKSAKVITFPNSGSAFFPWRPRFLSAISFSAIVGSSLFGGAVSDAADIVPTANVVTYADCRPTAKYRFDAEDAGVVLRHGRRPGDSEYLGGCDDFGLGDLRTYFT